MNQQRARHQAIALSAVFQSSLLADQIASHGNFDPTALSALFHGTLNLNPDSYTTVYPSLAALHPGMDALAATLSNGPGGHHDQFRAVGYALGLLHLGTRLRKDDALASILRNRLEALAAQHDQHTDLSDDHFCQQLATIYLDTLGTLNFRIKVQGEPQHLRNEKNAARIRAVFLAGVRAAVLWHQAGGRRWRLLLNRTSLLQAVNELRA